MNLFSQRFKYYFILLFFVLLIEMTPVYGTESYSKYWSVANVIGPLSNNPAFKYYFEPQLRLINNPYVFNEFFLLGGLGYQFNPTMIFFMGPGWVLSRNPQGIMSHEDRFWEQLNWQVFDAKKIIVNSRTRMEERKNTDYSSIALRFRERVWMRFPMMSSPDYFFSCFDEVFFNLNHPKWVSPYFFEQNRAFIGLGARMNSSTLIDIGYLNQYIHSTVNQLDNVWLLSFTINL